MGHGRGGGVRRDDAGRGLSGPWGRGRGDEAGGGSLYEEEYIFVKRDNQYMHFVWFYSRQPCNIICVSENTSYLQRAT